ncbi:MAG TPA: DUF881 domain-containing protein [Actinomycetales bacterium]|nr:DUF881 domain-containing protein [Actinomycetales bacterium]
MSPDRNEDRALVDLERREFDRRLGAGQEAEHRASLAGSGTQGQLRQLLENPIDMGYSREEPTHEAGLLGRLVSVLLIAVLTTASVWAAREMQRVRAGNQMINEQLISEVQHRGEARAELETDIAALRAELEQQQELLAPAPAEETDYLRMLGATVGTLPVEGEGLVIELNDTAVTDPLGRIRDFDLQVVTNALWSLGAEAIAINGERLSGATALRSAGQAILVNLVPLTPPYRVEVIGNATDLQVGLARTRASGHLAMLRDNYSVGVSITLADELSLPAATTTTSRGIAVPIDEDEEGNLVR